MTPNISRGRNGSDYGYNLKSNENSKSESNICSSRNSGRDTIGLINQNINNKNGDPINIEAEEVKARTTNTQNTAINQYNIRLKDHYSN